MFQGIWNEIKRFFTHGSVLARLIGINVAVFIIVNLLSGIFYLADTPRYTDYMIYNLSVPSSTEMLFYKPWTVISYMFLHLNFFHILFNMILLYVGGRLFIDFIGKNRIIGTYIIGGVAGAFLYVAAFNVFPVFKNDLPLSVAMGASASVLSIFIAIAAYKPNVSIPLILIGPVRLKYLAIVFIVVDLISIHKGNAGGHIAHIGGAIWGLVYIGLLKKGLDPAKYVGNVVDSIGGFFSPKPRLKVHYYKPRPEPDDVYNKRKAENQKQVDEILDKISKHGYDSLSQSEKELLFKMSKK
ncbi:MAG: rhomboid family intramembrane serine protease [Bacteroidetes bacterium]|nr:rhomboid family intramembrane serine protease [Bacteroidota bacterium]